MGHTRDWIDIFQALLTPVIALIALGIAFAQWWTARNKFRLDMFDRRWAVYVAVREILTAMSAQGNVSDEAQREFLRGIRGAKWLFDNRIDFYLSKELWPQITTLQGVNMMLGPDVQERDRQSGQRKRFEIIQWAISQEAAVDAMFDNFLRMDQGFFTLFPGA